mmetsp:Transcript_5678/g.12394  ORF Transcript_5678/g.12394 Transcript_5678/m.12394 type:complete len:212 (-) Transcript_5678:643-1278(-)
MQSIGSLHSTGGEEYEYEYEHSTGIQYNYEYSIQHGGRRSGRLFRRDRGGRSRGCRFGRNDECRYDGRDEDGRRIATEGCRRRYQCECQCRCRCRCRCCRSSPRKTHPDRGGIGSRTAERSCCSRRGSLRFGIFPSLATAAAAAATGSSPSSATTSSHGRCVPQQQEHERQQQRQLFRTRNERQHEHPRHQFAPASYRSNAATPAKANEPL